MKPGPAISQKLGPMGINMGKVIQDINKATESFKGLKVPVELDVDTKTKNFKVNVFSPPVSELIKKEVGIELGSGASKKTKVGNLSIEQIIFIAKTKLGNMLCKDLRAAVKSVLGSCVSLGVMVENKEAKEISQELSKYDKEISQEKTKTDEKKLQELKSYFESVKRAQEEALKKEEAAKAAAEAAAAAAATAQPAAATEAAAGEKKAEAGKEAKPAAAGKEAAKPAAKPEAKKAPEKK